MSTTTHIYTCSDELPLGLSEENFFHSPALFTLSHETPRMRPYMVTVETEGRHVAQMLALVRTRTSFFPPYLYRHCQILGEGIYTEDAPLPRNELFGLMLHALTSRLGRWLLYIEVSHLSQKMFGFRELREQKFFPVRWMSIHNSLHSHAPEERISRRMQQRIDSAYLRGVVTNEVKTDEDFEAFFRLLKHHNWLKPKRYIPDQRFFRRMHEQGSAKLALTRWHEHVIGCSATVYSHGQAYLWYAAYKRKSYAKQHPDLLTIWYAIKKAHQEGCQHIYFMDVGLPFRKNAFRDFILRFGGKPTSTYRWFRCSISWINRLLSWIYRE